MPFPDSSPSGRKVGWWAARVRGLRAAQHPGLCNSRHWFRTATQRVSIRTLHTAPAWRGDASVPRQSLHLKQANYASEHPLKTSTGFGSLGSVAQTPRTKQHCGLLFPTGLAPSRTFRLGSQCRLTPSAGGQGAQPREGPHPTPPPTWAHWDPCNPTQETWGSSGLVQHSRPKQPRGARLVLGNAHTPRAPPVSAN